MEWVRGRTVGRGMFALVSLVLPTNNSSEFPSMVVKSCHNYESESLKTEKEVLLELGHCPEIVRFFGDQVTSEQGCEVYNLFLEYASKGSLDDHRKNSGGKFNVSDVKRYTKSILKGLCHVHDMGFAHCDIKLQNILVFHDDSVKIADFGLAERVTEKEDDNKFRLKGTPLYMSPELAITGDIGFPADVWALGCLVAEMVSGEPAWSCSSDCAFFALLHRIGRCEESPEIPASLCAEGKDFLNKCFIIDPNERWTAHMLLDHPFISGSIKGGDHKQSLVSPKCPFDLLDWESMNPPTPNPVACSGSSEFKFWVEEDSGGPGLGSGCWVAVSRRVEELVSNEKVPDWCDEDGWFIVR